MKELQLDLQEKTDQLQEEQSRSKAQYDKNEEIVENIESLKVEMAEKDNKVSDLNEKLKNQKEQEEAAQKQIEAL